MKKFTNRLPAAIVRDSTPDEAAAAPYQGLNWRALSPEAVMTLRCGIDMIEIDRVEAGIARMGERFLQRFFTPVERAQCADKPARLAARLAAKEAVGKALGTGIGEVGWREIEVICDNRGRPWLHLHGHAAALAGELGLAVWDISLTHTRSHAAAMVVAMAAPGRPSSA